MIKTLWSKSGGAILGGGLVGGTDFAQHGGQFLFDILTYMSPIEFDPVSAKYVLGVLAAAVLTGAVSLVKVSMSKKD